jgi:hypothetical protein
MKQTTFYRLIFRFYRDGRGSAAKEDDPVLRLVPAK